MDMSDGKKTNNGTYRYWKDASYSRYMVVRYQYNTRTRLVCFNVVEFNVVN